MRILANHKSRLAGFSMLLAIGMVINGFFFRGNHVRIIPASSIHIIGFSHTDLMLEIQGREIQTDASRRWRERFAITAAKRKLPEKKKALEQEAALSTNSQSAEEHALFELRRALLEQIEHAELLPIVLYAETTSDPLHPFILTIDDEQIQTTLLREMTWKERMQREVAQVRAWFAARF